VATAVTVAGSLGVAAAGFLPWSRTGRSRSGLELARTLHEVGLAPGRPLGTLLVLFLFTPLLAAAVWIAALTRRRLLVALLGTATGAVAVAAALLLRTSSLRTDEGGDVAMAAGLLAMAGAAVLAFLWRDEEGDR
jgi:hypothetical protein